MKKQLIITAMASSMVLAGCTTTGSTTSNTANTTTNTASTVGTTASNAISTVTQNKPALGAVLGAAAGAAISKATGGEKTGRDALIGAAVGTAVGVYMNEQAKKLETQMAGTGVDVKIDPKTNDIKLVMPSNITFDINKADIKPQFTKSLDELAKTLNQYEKTSIIITGHTDSTGNDAINMPLSEARANAVAQYLYNRSVDSNRLFVQGKGSSAPIASNATEAGREQNRRVEIKINAPSSL